MIFIYFCFCLFILTQRYFIAFLTGKVQNSSYTRLKGSNSVDDQHYEDNIKQRAWKLIQKVENGGLDNIRTELDDDLFRTFVDLCLITLSSASAWRYKSYSNVLSDIFTASDEAFAMLMLENNAGDLRYVYDNQKLLSRKNSKPKYTKVQDNSRESFCGWHKNGILRYNELYDKVTTHRKRQTCMSRELALRDEYAKVCGKFEDNINNVRNVNNDSEDEDNDGIYVQAIDGFDGIMPTLDELENNDDGVLDTAQTEV